MKKPTKPKKTKKTKKPPPKKKPATWRDRALKKMPGDVALENLD